MSDYVRLQYALDTAMRLLVKQFPACSIVLLIAPFNGPKDARVNYISNSQRQDVLAMMKEVVVRFDSQHKEPTT